ncbi:MAG: N-acetylmuramoyl-L-alanine amidase [bacterium]|nr:N-acetylmuramoyl-L-alanine amidase [bacterium]
MLATLRPVLLVATTAVAGAVATLPAQHALFVHRNDLIADARHHQGAAAALDHLLRGPTASQRAAGWTSHVPAGTRLQACRVTGDHAQLVFDDTLLAATAIEDALEQLQKTALTDPSIAHTSVAIRLRNGREEDITTVLGHDRLPTVPRAESGNSSFVATQGALSGRRIAISPGHGYYWHSSLGWTTQRPLIDGLLEDIHVAEICNRYLIPMLQNMGAEVVLTRETGEVLVDAVADNDSGAPTYTETGTWLLSGSSGYQGGTYRFVGATATETATANWRIPVTRDGLYPVYAWFRASTNRTPVARYRVTHAGGTSSVEVDQSRDNLTWVWLGSYWFNAGDDAVITLSNESPSNGVVIADAVRLGGGVGSIVRGSGTSGRPRWQEAARYWTQYAGAPTSVYDTAGADNSDDVTTRPRFAEWRGADAYVSLHTNAGGGAGTSSFIYSGGATAGSSTLQSRIHTQIIQDLRAEWSSTWVDRGQRSANFGEVRLLSTMPGVLLELAFHDQAGSFDHTSLHQPEFRYLGARAIARGIMRYFAAAAPFVPEPPTALRVTQDGNGGLRVAWDTAPGATGYVVEWSDDGKGFVQAGTTTAPFWSTGPLPYHSMKSFRVRATNGSGCSMPTEVLTAGTDHNGTASVLLVQAFDRLDRAIKAPDNTRDYLRHFGDAIRRDATFSLGFDAASNEAIERGRVTLDNYRCAVWSLGEESTTDETFTPFEQFLVNAFLNAGGRLLVSGAEVAWDLDWLGSASDRAFYRNQLGTTYVADDANVYTVRGVPGTVSAGLPLTAFDNGQFGTYDVNYPDVLTATPSTGAVVCLQYGNGQFAGVQRIDPVTAARTVTFGFPLVTMTDPVARAQLVRQSLAFLLADQPLTTTPTAPLGQRLNLELAMPGEAGQLYQLLVSEGNDIGIPLPGGNLIPLRPGFLIGSSLDPGNPLYGNFLGLLDASGRASAWVDVPNLGFLNGFEVWFAAFTVDPTSLLDRTVTNWVRVTLGP